MAGYDGWSMSNNARDAYDDGRVPLTGITREWLDANGIGLPVEHARWLARTHVGPSEWHHSSKMYNKTNFYDADQIREHIQEHGDHADQFRARDALSTPPVPAVASWTEWTGTGRNKRKVEHRDVEGHVIGDWFHHPGGKKSTKGNWIKVTYPRNLGRQFE